MEGTGLTEGGNPRCSPRAALGQGSVGPGVSPETARTEVAPRGGSPCRDPLQGVWGPLQLVRLWGPALFAEPLGLPMPHFGRDRLHLRDSNVI